MSFEENGLDFNATKNSSDLDALYRSSLVRQYLICITSLVLVVAAAAVYCCMQHLDSLDR